MTSIELQFYDFWFARSLFKLKVSESDGTQYEDLFSKIMTYSNPNFTPVEPYGNEGDRKNDGYDPTTGVFYQVFAPKDASTPKAKHDAVKKAKRDFLGMIKFWDSKGIVQVQEYHFALNDKYKGSTPTLEVTLSEIKKKHGLRDSKIFLNKDLEEILFNLSPDKIAIVIGSFPDARSISESLKLSALNEVISHIMNTSTHIDSYQLMDMPDFDEKVKFNGLSKKIAALLNTGQMKEAAIEEYFDTTSSHNRQATRNHLNKMYQEVRAEVTQTVEPGEVANVTFMTLWKKITNSSRNSDVQNAAIALMSYYFVFCDIFEQPVYE